MYSKFLGIYPDPHKLRCFLDPPPIPLPLSLNIFPPPFHGHITFLPIRSTEPFSTKFHFTLINPTRSCSLFPTDSSLTFSVLFLLLLIFRVPNSLLFWITLWEIFFSSFFVSWFTCFFHWSGGEKFFGRSHSFFPFLLPFRSCSFMFI